MVATKSNIELKRYRGNGSTLFTGRPQGEEARRELALDNIDKSEQEVEFIIPEGTTSFNPSFYLGLLYNSIKELGIDRFTEKYNFIILDENPETKRVIEENLNDGFRYAINTINNKSGLRSWIKKIV